MTVVEAADYHQLSIPSQPRLSPDGEHVVFVRRQPVDEETYESTLHLAQISGDRKARRFSLREGEDSSPRWSPSGDRIAFASTRGAEDDRQQLWIVPIDGGEGHQVTSVAGGVADLAWSPDGTHIAFVQSVTATEREEEHDRYVEEDYERDTPDPRVIDRTVYRTMQEYHDGRRSHVYLVDLEEAANGPVASEIKQVTTGEVSAGNPRWLDEETLIYTDEWIGDDPDDSIDFEICCHDLDSDEIDRLHRSTAWTPAVTLSTEGRIAVPVVSPDQASLQPGELDVIDPSTGTVTRVTEQIDRSVTFAIEPQWGPEEVLYFVTPDRGNMTVWSVDPTAPDSVAPELSEGAISGISVGGKPDDPTVAVTMSQWDHPGDVFAYTDGDLRRLTHCNESYLSDVQVGEPAAVSFESAGNDVQGWLLTPPNTVAEPPYPLVVEVHGGPHVMWTTAGTMWQEFQFLAARGYAVFWSNPRGSAGYGRSFMQAIERAWGRVTLEDVMAGVDTVSDRPEIDEDTVFLTGGSFGGFLTAWALGHTDRFTAAVAQRGVYDLTSFYGSTDRAYKLVEGDFDTTPWEEPDFLWDQSPASRAHRIDTPTLVIHSDRDYRTPTGSAELFHRILRKQGVETRMVRYPREGHELSRSGEPAHVVDRLERIARWFDGYSPYHDVPPALDREADAGLSVETNE